MIEQEVHKSGGFINLELLARQVVEGFISGIHKSPFHGFSAEFAEHKIYNNGESTKHIDWKLYAKTDKLYTKRYEEETNLRCHLIIDNSSSMHFPIMKSFNRNSLNKIAFSVLAAASLMQILKRQRDAVGLSVYSDEFNFYAPEKGSERHHHMLLNELDRLVANPARNRTTDSYKYLHQIAEKLKRRSLVFLFTDMFQEDKKEEELFEALKHLKYNKHEVVLFHVIDKEKELNFDFDNAPKRFVDVESGAHLDLYAENFKESYQDSVAKYFHMLKLQCAKYRIKYVQADIGENFEKILTTYLVERQKFAG
ncbi:uncharacterized protein DUF58 [Gillisia mitskevichiae]|uniref:Uncharacterized protein DUF58 n=1 Tax=Gillisia mitskevichiae TaxID=270921 RepID=A0A495PZB8_9FLAO|nr:DUF58 domain-containing protein [Gillisia mitskevichiae]RKS55869.1 uncharacterized protein DUF58 [Gillisia mitskevichiae]